MRVLSSTSANQLSDATPLVESGAGAPGTSKKVARADHVHPAAPAPSVPTASNANPLAPGVAAPGTSPNYARGDHVHPAQTVPSASNATPQPLGVAASGASPDYSRADHVHASVSVPQPATVAPLAPGSAAVGTSLLYARQDHVHPAQTVPSAASVLPLANGTAAVGSSLAYAREDHVHPTTALAVAPSTPARTIGAAFQPNATKAVFASYSCTTQVTNPLLAGNSSALVRLLSDANNPPTTERCRVAAFSSVGVAVTVALTTSNTAPLDYIVPPGHYVLLSSTISGTASVSIAAQTEEVLG